MRVFLIKDLKEWEALDIDKKGTINEDDFIVGGNRVYLIYAENDGKYVCHSIKEKAGLAYTIKLINSLIEKL